MAPEGTIELLVRQRQRRPDRREKETRRRRRRKEITSILIVVLNLVLVLPFMAGCVDGAASNENGSRQSQHRDKSERHNEITRLHLPRLKRYTHFLYVGDSTPGNGEEEDLVDFSSQPSSQLQDRSSLGVVTGSGSSSALAPSLRSDNPSGFRDSNYVGYINLTAIVKKHVSGTLYCNISFNWPLQPNQSTVRNVYNNVTLVQLQVHVLSEICSNRRPSCVTEPNRSRHIPVNAVPSKWKSLIVRNLTYNTLYWIMIDAQDQTLTPSSQKILVRTPDCPNPDHGHMLCPEQPPLAAVTTIDPINRVGSVNVTCVHYQPKLNLLSVQLEWSVPTSAYSDHDSFISYSHKRNIDERGIKHPKEADASRPRVAGEGNSWTTSILVQLLKDNVLAIYSTMETNTTSALIKLSINQFFDIMTNVKNGSMLFMYKTLYINTSLDHVVGETARYRQCPYMPLASMPSDIPDQSTSSIMFGLIGLLMFASITLTTLIVICEQRCHLMRHIFPRLNKTNTSARSRTQPALNGYDPSPTVSAQLLLPRAEAMDQWEVNPSYVSLGAEIGQGAFGRVLTGYYQKKEIAIKVLKDNVPEGGREDLLREIALMKSVGSHPNIVAMVGACTVREPVALLMDYMPFGNLQSFLRKCRTDRELHGGIGGSKDNLTYCLLDEMTGRKECWHVTANDVLSFARQISVAMEFLAEKQIVHRDLAARNILLGSSKVVKLCDFGLARVVTDDEYIVVKSRRLPLKWMAPESIKDRVFTTHSDVWSFGILLWEIVTLGASPYPTIALVDIYRLLEEGYRMPQPKNCADELYDIMSQCWYETPSNRPSFSHIRRQLELLLSRNTDYLDLDNIDAPLNHSQTDDSVEEDSPMENTTGLQASETVSRSHRLQDVQPISCIGRVVQVSCASPTEQATVQIGHSGLRSGDSPVRALVSHRPTAGCAVAGRVCNQVRYERNMLYHDRYHDPFNLHLDTC